MKIARTMTLKLYYFFESRTIQNNQYQQSVQTIVKTCYCLLKFSLRERIAKRLHVTIKMCTSHKMCTLQIKTEDMI